MSWELDRSSCRHLPWFAGRTPPPTLNLKVGMPDSICLPCSNVDSEPQQGVAYGKYNHDVRMVFGWHSGTSQAAERHTMSAAKHWFECFAGLQHTSGGTFGGFGKDPERDPKNPQGMQNEDLFPKINRFELRTIPVS